MLACPAPQTLSSRDSFVGGSQYVGQCQRRARPAHLQIFEAASPCQNMCGDFGQCPQDPDLGCANRDAAREISPTAIDVRLVPIESGGALTAAIVCLPRSVGLDGWSFPTAADTGNAARTTGVAAWLEERKRS